MEYSSSYSNNKTRGHHQHLSSSSSSCSSSIQKCDSSPSCLINNNQIINHNDNNGDTINKDNSNLSDNRNNNLMILGENIVNCNNNLSTTTRSTCGFNFYSSSSQSSIWSTFCRPSSSPSSSSSSSSSSSYSLHSSYSVPRISTLIVTLFLSLNYLFIISSIPSVSAQYRPKWPSPIVQREIFLLNLEDGYFGCQVNESTDFLQLFELSKLCDGLPQCFLGSDELALELKCGDRNHCHPKMPKCINGACLDNLCHCNDGFGGKGCDLPDENECKYRPCDVFAHCTNTLGSFYCTCNPGYEGDGFTCHDTNECEVPALAGLCADNAECCNLPGHFSCKCKEGFTGNATESCFDIDECADSSTCGRGAECHNTPGGYSCHCPAGFTGNPTKECWDIDECKSSVCGEGAICTNLPGSYECTCPTGFKGDPKAEAGCVDVDECSQTDRQLCGTNANCVNTAGDYFCQCPQGYTGNARISCIDVDECKLNVCAEGTICTNLPGSYECTCPVGFRSDAKSETGCVDVDECSQTDQRKQLCGTNANCVNTVGDYFCQCPQGYTGNARIACTDINECATNACGLNTICTNILGGYNCQCKPGFTGDAFLSAGCTDINECIFGPKPCGGNTSCVNTDGAYKCICLEGFIGNPKKGCKSPCEGITCSAHASCQVKSNEAACVCDAGYTYDPNNISSGCVDINECAAGPYGLCGEGAICINTIGGHQCKCPLGYTGDPFTFCEPGCLEDKDCPLNQGCVNEQCVDPCASKKACGINAVCLVEYHKKVCSCGPGTEGNARIECTRESIFCENSNDCENGALCEANICRSKCGSDNECFDNEKCADGVCTSTCKTDETCPSGFVCELGQCRIGCRSSNECPSTSACINRKCIDPCASRSACGTNAICRVDNHEKICSCKSGTDGNPRIECTRQSLFCENANICGKDAICEANVCRSKCDSDDSCLVNEKCANGLCTTTCSNDDSCPPRFVCEFGQCQTGCRSNNECPSSSSCLNRKCIDPCALKTSCGTNAICRCENHEKICSCKPGTEGNPRTECIRQSRFCDSSNDCGDRAVCEANVCRFECYNDAECFDNEKCFEGFCTSTCKTDESCSLGFVCELGQCKTGCRSDNECPTTASCINRKCIDPCASRTACGTNAVCRVDNHEKSCSCKPGTEGNPRIGCTRQSLYCENSNACGNRAICEANVCRFECYNENDCFDNEKCSDGFCTSSCKTDESCPGGFVCDAGQCKTGCRSDKECPSSAACMNRKCIDPCASKTACGANAICRCENHEKICSCKPGTEGNPRIECVRQSSFCESSSDCGNRAICEANVCRFECYNDAECFDNEKCAEGFCTSSCKTDEACPPGFVCESGKCKAGCRSDVECSSTGACMNNKCIDPCASRTACGTNAICRVENHEKICSCGPGTEGNPRIECIRQSRFCESSDDCGKGAQCDVDVCRFECNGDEGCFDNEKCADGFCTSSCKTDESCPPGFVCDSGQCKTGCRSDNECPLSKACMNHRCIDVCGSPFACGTNAKCTAINHSPWCTCPPRFTGNPRLECKKIECVSDADCATSTICINYKCVSGLNSTTCRLDAGCRNEPPPQCNHDSECVLGQICENAQCIGGCRHDNNCPEDKACINTACENPCLLPKACGHNTVCQPYQHRPRCECQPNFRGNPFTGCDPIPDDYCDADSSCPLGKICENNKCLDGCRNDGNCKFEDVCINKVCTNPCSIYGACGNNAICKPTNHDRVCTCKPDHTGDPKISCERIRPPPECLDDKQCPLEHICQNTHCVRGCRDSIDNCPTDKTCIRGKCIDPCSTSGSCGEGAICSPANHVAVCSCPSGFRGDPDVECREIPPECRYDADCGLEKICLKQKCITGCRTHSNCPFDKACFNGHCQSPCNIGGICGINTICRAENHEAQCTCVSGYTGDPLRQCTKIHVECETDLDCGQGYVCAQQKCRDINECLQEVLPCGPGASCQNLPGFFKCSCPLPLVGNAYSKEGCRQPVPICFHDADCKDDQKCNPVTQECYDVCTKSGICGKGALCRSLNSKAECECLPGHRGNPYVECSIRDSCSLPSDCPGNLLCLGQYCGCPYPYEQRSSFCVLSSLNCTTTNPCPNDQTCIYDGQGDKTGYCACPKGYMMTLEGTCRDYNECEEKAFPCGPGAKCMNKLGSYDCRCPTGTLGDPFVAGCLTEQQLKHCFHDSDCPDDRSCIEFECRDSCLTSNNCGQNAICYMEGHRRKCKCRPGFSGNPTEICRPIADCVTDSGCPGNLACLRDHRCGCPLEFNRVLDYCVRFSYNCSTTNPCPDNQECIYSGTESGFCVCPRGFTLRPDGVCDDINECNEKNICGPHASCVNRLGTYECRCAAGYQGEDPYRDGCTLMSKEPPGCLSDQDCPSTKKCDFSNGQCFDPCTTRDENRCGANALCSTSNHIVSCSCPSGFEGNPNKLCSPIRECGVTYQCPGNLVCLNSRTCGCPSNYSRENDYCLIRSQNCTTTNPCPPNEECVYTGVRAGFCICPHGYELTPRGECKEIPVCARDNPCAPGAICRDQPGSYVCICPVDTIGDPYVKGCDQVFGCQTNSDCPLDKECDIRSRQCISPCHTCGPNAECAVRDHKAVCVCAPGQVGQADDKEIGCFVPPPPPDVPTVRTIPPVQDLTVMCLAEGVQVAVRLGGYDGIIYVKGHSQDPNCRRLVTSQERDSIDFKVNFSVCGLVPINGEASFILVIQKHPKLVTYRARAYHIKCLYMSGERTVTLGFNVSMITTSGTIANTGPPPTCLMSITSIDGKEVTSAEIGDDLLLKVDVQPDFIYGGFARSCVAKTMEDEGEFQYEVTDANGCATDPSIFGNWEYDTHKKQLMARFNAFKFPSSNNLRFQCNIRVCFGSCPPVNCDGVDAYGKRRRRGVKDEDLLADAFKEGALREEIMVQSNAILTFEKRDPQPSASLEGQRLEDADHICLPKLGLIISMILTTLLAIVAVAFAISCWLMAYRRKPRRPGPLIHPPDFPNPLYTSPEHVAEPSPDYYHGSHL